MGRGSRREVEEEEEEEEGEMEKEEDEDWMKRRLKNRIEMR